MALAMLLLLLVATAPACRGGSATASATSEVPFVPVDPNSASPTDRAIAAAQVKLRVDSANPDALLDLASAYLQKAREVADPTLYTKISGIIAVVAKQHAGDLRLLLVEGTLDLAEHRFAEALDVGHRAVATDPSSSGAYGVVVDACNELGRYDEALTATQKMLDLQPDLPALSRASFAKELRGDLPGAITLMTQAVTAGGTAGGENVAYVQVQLGTLLLTSGNLAGAEAQFDAANVSFPGFAAAKAGRAKILVAEGRPADAARLLAQVVDVQPLAEYAIAEGDDLSASGQADAAAQAYQLVGAIEELYRASGVNVDLELALFDADHTPGQASLARARAGFKVRPSYLGHETLAWNLYKIAQLDQAGHEMDLALALGSHDPLLRYQAAVIAHARGYDDVARDDLSVVLGENPRFSALYQTQVVSLASRLGLTVSPPPSTTVPGAAA